MMIISDLWIYVWTILISVVKPRSANFNVERLPRRTIIANDKNFLYEKYFNVNGLLVILLLGYLPIHLKIIIYVIICSYHLILH